MSVHTVAFSSISVFPNEHLFDTYIFIVCIVSDVSAHIFYWVQASASAIYLKLPDIGLINRLTD